MAEFKQSKLMGILSGMLSQDAMDFIDACMDDFCVDETMDGETRMYELRGTMVGWRDGKEVRITEVYYSDLSGMASLIEYLALTHMLLIEHIDKCIEENNFEKRV